MPKAKSANAVKKLPVHAIRMGSINAAIWKNDTANGVRYNVTFSHRYRDGENLKSSEAFGRDDLLVVAKAAGQAHSWIHA
jgi:hypothetical protein